ncbi:DUF3800 domain-containing protein [Polyangium fumosum]|uniref:DUF3800 domain-containing protein n=1 Tax=Polyangium fumosum TaxID=889272 RepID=A0A4U1IUS5_9BACT|nr:DUF3800 domain-containing protein [Polyangium fumosum]TKC98151.1 DUF3800 domain-containing protein [Polyangium fumosum]
MTVELEIDIEPPPGVLRWLISCDESGVDGSQFYGFGSLWMKWQRRGEFHAAIKELRERHGYSAEIKWTNVRPRYIAFYRDLVDFFFRTNWLVFHCLVVRKAKVKKELHRGSFDLARQKHFTMLLTNKIKRCLRTHKGREQTFRIWVDPIASSYKKADEVVEIIANRVLRRVFGEVRPVDKVFTHDSKEKASIQLCDLLLGAVMAAWRQEASAAVKLDLQKCIADYLTWPDLRSDTHRDERKFNIWYFYDPSQGDREVETRQVKLVHPLEGAG